MHVYIYGTNVGYGKHLIAITFDPGGGVVLMPQLDTTNICKSFSEHFHTFAVVKLSLVVINPLVSS